VDFCHKNGVIHRDVKDENLIVDMETMKIKLIDFGSASLLQSEPYRDFKGTRVYSAPEVFQEKRFYGEPSTIWSLGILLYNMIFGNIPFHNEKEICNGKFYITNPITNELFCLLNWMLAKDHRNRPTLQQVIQHTWLDDNKFPKNNRPRSTSEGSDTSVETKVTHLIP